MRKITIAIDGFSSCGKSTLAKAIANKLGYRYIDTGAMYRATTLYMMRAGVINSDGALNQEHLLQILDDIDVNFRYSIENKQSETLLNGENVEKEIRSMEVSGQVSKVSLIKEVRKKMIALQKHMGREKAVVMEGRDIGTAVFPDAELKIFMTADTEVRVRRRYDELISKGQQTTEDEVRKNLEARDYDDTHRKENPLRKAQDAVLLDNSELNPQQQLDFVLRLAADLQLLKES
jgi:cytidylate kinase